VRGGEGVSKWVDVGCWWVVFTVGYVAVENDIDKLKRYVVVQYCA
jgi:hypothetical protein